MPAAAADVGPGTGRSITRDAAEGVDGSRNIELLLELNAKGGAPVENPSPPKLTPEAARLAAKVLGLPAPEAGAGLPARTSGRPAPGDPDWVPTKPLAISNPFGGSGVGVEEPRSSPGRGFPPSHTHGEVEDDVRWLLPRELVRFVKQNRELVIGGSVVVLLLLWAATAFGGRRK